MEQPEANTKKFRNDTTKITLYGCYNVELDLYEENGEQRSQCVVSCGDYSASLELLQHQGALDSPEGIKKDVPARALHGIVRWAFDNGY